MEISGHRTAAMLWRYNITDTRDVKEAGNRTGKYLADMHSRPVETATKRKNLQ